MGGSATVKIGKEVLDLVAVGTAGGAPAPLPGPVVYSVVPAELGSFGPNPDGVESDATFTPAVAGSGTITATSGSLSASVDVVVEAVVADTLTLQATVRAV